MSDNTRDRIINAADALFYQKGFEHTSFSDIANSVGISKGNFYHHFKTKNEILNAVIDFRLFRTRELLNAWHTSEAEPDKRIQCFIKILITNRAKIKLYGCPVGTLTTELGKLSHPLSMDANKIFTLFKDWLASQFEELGKCKSESEALAMQLLARSQGSATIASAFGDDGFLYEEVESHIRWLNEIK